MEMYVLKTLTVCAVNKKLWISDFVLLQTPKIAAFKGSQRYLFFKCAAKKCCRLAGQDLRRSGELNWNENKFKP